MSIRYGLFHTGGGADRIGFSQSSQEFFYDVDGDQVADDRRREGGRRC